MFARDGRNLQMNIFSKPILGVLLLSCASLGCSDSSADISKTVSTAHPEFQLSQEPSDPLEVLDAKERAQDGEPIVVVGRLGGGVEAWIEGRAAFLLADTRILPACEVDEQCEDGCKSCSEEMMAACTMVKFLDGDGKVLPVDARTLLGLKDQEIVVVQGTAKRDQAGNVSIAGNGIFIRR